MYNSIDGNGTEVVCSVERIYIQGSIEEFSEKIVEGHVL